MAKKRVPGWLNSSLWSSTAPPDDDHRLGSHATTASSFTYKPATSSPTAADSPVQPPVPAPPPYAVRPERPKVEIRDPFSNISDNGSSWSPSAEDISRQAQLVQEETLLRICCAMLILVRRHLLAGDFTSNLKWLQRYPSTNIGCLLKVANKLRTLQSPY